MPDYDEVLERAADRSAFSNGTEYEAWYEKHCPECRHDDDCPLLLAVLADDVTPVEWEPDRPGSLGDQYRCTKFEASGG